MSEDRTTPAPAPVVVVTGAAGDIGRKAAACLIRDGWRVALLDRRVDEVQRASADLADTAGAESVMALAVDQTDRNAVESGLAEIESRFGPVTGLFANAGFGKFATFLETTERSWTKHLDVNLTGTFNVCQVVARIMVAARRPGAFVINASSGAWVHSDLLSAYCSTKAAVRMLALGMASELGVHRIRVNCVMPGVIETGMTSSMLSDSRHRDWLLSETPVGRLGDPADIAELVSFLLSARSAFITGASIPIDGGQTIHGHPRWFATDYRRAHDERWEIGK